MRLHSEIPKPQSTNYRITWRKIFQSSRRDTWTLVLLLVELLFLLPVSNAKVERLFSLMNMRIKTDFRSSLSQKTLKNLVLICMEGPDSNSCNDVWNDAVKARRPAQKTKRMRKYKKGVKKTKSTTLMETDTTTTESDIQLQVTMRHNFCCITPAFLFIIYSVSVW